MKPALSSLYQAVELHQEIPPLLIGERNNTNGSKLFREFLLADDFEGCLQVALDQEREGAQVLDLCVAYAGRNELEDMERLVKLFVRSVRVPLMIDSTIPEVVEAALKLYPGRCIINSINLEDGGITARKICQLVKKYGAAVVALTIDESGMAMSAADKLQVARQLYKLAVNECGLRPQDLLFDVLTFTVGSGEEATRNAAYETISAIKAVKKELPGCSTVLGVSNISFGLPPPARRVLNSVFLHEAVTAGLDAAIVDAGKILPLAKISAEERELSLNLLYNRGMAEGDDPLMALIAYYRDSGQQNGAAAVEHQFKSAAVALSQQVIEGNRDGIEDNLIMLLESMDPLAIINQILVPTMRQVGMLFGKGEMLLPFVLHSAEVMKTAVSLLEPYMSQEQEGQQTRLLLATVQGDVHDIGKNLVDIILSNNGFKVRNLGIKVPAEIIIKEAQEWQADVIGLSGLLVKSAMIMRDSLHQYQTAGLTQPILLGGAALTPRFVAEECVPNYAAPVVYCKDVFDGLKSMRQFEEGQLAQTIWEDKKTTTTRDVAEVTHLEYKHAVPTPPMVGANYVTDITLSDLIPHINQQALFRGRWGYRKARMSQADYAKLVAEKVEPLYQKLLDSAAQAELVQPKVAYGYFPCYSQGDQLLVEHGGQTSVFAFPRQKNPPHLCIADYFKSQIMGGDVAAFFVVSIGERLGKAAQQLFESNNYHDYLMLHGLGVELAEALAEYWHGKMRQQMGIDAVPKGKNKGVTAQPYRGARYGFGYVACPDLNAQRIIFDLLQPEKLGLELTENMMIVPEFSTAALITHHPQASYFMVS